MNWPTCISRDYVWRVHPNFNTKNFCRICTLISLLRTNRHSLLIILVFWQTQNFFVWIGIFYWLCLHVEFSWTNHTNWESIWINSPLLLTDGLFTFRALFWLSQQTGPTAQLCSPAGQAGLGPGSGTFTVCWEYFIFKEVFLKSFVYNYNKHFTDVLVSCSAVSCGWYQSPLKKILMTVFAIHLLSSQVNNWWF